MQFKFNTQVKTILEDSYTIPNKSTAKKKLEIISTLFKDEATVEQLQDELNIIFDKEERTGEEGNTYDFGSKFITQLVELGKIAKARAKQL